MIATRRERNLNDIAWPVVDEERGHTYFTPCQPLEAAHVIKSPDWPAEPEPKNVPCNPVDEDIRLGRTKSFSSMEALIADLDEPE